MSKRPLEDVVYSGLKIAWLVSQVVLILLKLIGVLHVSWLWILLPTWGIPASFMIILMCVFAYVIIRSCIDIKHDDMDK